MRNRTLTLASLLAVALLMTACGDDTTRSTGGTGSSSESATVDFNDADVDFATGMKPHHAQAVEMSDIVLAADPTPEVAALAERVKAAQAPEIEELEAMLEHFGVDDAGAGGHGGGHGSGHGGGGGTAVHGGMMTDAQLAELEAMTGAEASRTWLTMMIEHHQGAIEAAETELAEGQYPPALDLAARIKADQAAEVAEMQQLLTRL